MRLASRLRFRASLGSSAVRTTTTSGCVAFRFGRVAPGGSEGSEGSEGSDRDAIADPLSFCASGG